MLRELRTLPNRRYFVVWLAATVTGASMALPVVTNAQEPGDVVDTTITSNPKVKTKSTTATFEFTGSGPVTGFKCKFRENGVFKDCTSPKTYKHLKPGKQHFEVAATYQLEAPPELPNFPDEVQDQSPATYDWTIKKK